MAIIPAGQKILTVASTIDTNERKSTQNNSPSQYYAIEDVVETVEAGLPASPTTTVVNISSAQILSMGSSPIELLPAAGVGKYYDVEKIVIESTYNTSVYTVPSQLRIVVNGDVFSGVDPSIFLLEQNTICIHNTYTTAISNIDQNTYPRLGILNQNCYFTTAEGDSPTDGDGTLRAIITYTLRTFGA